MPKAHMCMLVVRRRYGSIHGTYTSPLLLWKRLSKAPQLGQVRPKAAMGHPSNPGGSSERDLLQPLGELPTVH